jgi:WD40 repeat protein
VFRGHTLSVDKVAFSLDGRWVVTTGEDQTARVWDVGTGKEITVLRGHTKLLTQAAFSPDGQWVVTVSSDGALVFRCELCGSLDELLAYARKKLGN